MNTRPKYHALIARHIGSDLLLTHTDIYTTTEYLARSEGLDTVWAKLIIAATGEVIAHFESSDPSSLKKPA